MARNLSFKKGKADSRILLDALLCYANGEMSEKDLKALQSSLTADFQKGNQLWVNKSTLADLADLVRRCGGSLSNENIRNALGCLKRLEIIQDNRKQISAVTVTNDDNWSFSVQFPSTVRAENIEWLFGKSGKDGEWDKKRRALKPAQTTDDEDEIEELPADESIDWQQICQQILAAQRQRLAFRRPITRQEYEGHEANIYVPLGLVKPRTAPKREPNFAPTSDKGTEQYQLKEQEIEKPYQNDEFLQEVIDKPGKNIAIVGEPGAGKTTWLDYIALHLEDGEYLPILIPLGSLSGQTLAAYLQATWLEEAQKFDHRVGVEELKTLFRSGKVWLLLDGVDEMQLDMPLDVVGKNLSGWVAAARVALTCRLNVWEANPNALGNFDTFRTLQFDDEQVAEFIQQWFEKDGNPAAGQGLQEKLKEAGKERIRDLVKNPLRLALLCGTWVFHRGNLPETKAGLYKQFQDYFYQWKTHPKLTENEDSENEDSDLQDKLHEALARLALAAIDQKMPLQRDFVKKVMGAKLFKLARDVGWLNLVYWDGKTREPVYAFFHLTFQEYFAALAVEDWHFFLNHFPENPSHADASYRIFEPQWKQVILMWFGREDVKENKKEEFINQLINFKDEFQNLYWFQSYFLAAEAVGEFKNSRYSNEILTQIVNWAFGYFDADKQSWHSFSPIDKKAYKIIVGSFREKAIIPLTDLLFFCKEEPINKALSENNGILFDKIIIAEIALAILEISPEHTEAQKLIKEVSNDERMIPKFWSEQLDLQGKIEFLKQRGIFSKFSFQQKPEKTKFKVINPGKPEEVIELINLLSIDDGSPQYFEAMSRLDEIVTGNPEAISPVIEIIKTSIIHNQEKDHYPLFKAIQCLEKIGTGNEEVIKLLFEVINNNVNYSNYAITTNAIWALRIIGYGNRDVFDFFIHLLNNENKFKVIVEPVMCLNNILQGELFQLAVKELRGYLQDSVLEKNRAFYINCYWTLWHCAQNLPYLQFYQAWHHPAITPHPEVADNIPVGNTPTVQNLERLMAPLIEQLLPPDNTYLLAINAATLGGETDSSEIAQRLCNWIFDQIPGAEIPEVKKLGQLERQLSNLKKRLQKTTLALIILPGCSPYPELETFLGQLTSQLQICWLTDAKLAPPLLAIPPQQEDLLSAIQSWLDEMG